MKAFFSILLIVPLLSFGQTKKSKCDLVHKQIDRFRGDTSYYADITIGKLMLHFDYTLGSNDALFSLTYKNVGCVDDDSKVWFIEGSFKFARYNMGKNNCIGDFTLPIGKTANDDFFTEFQENDIKAIRLETSETYHDFDIPKYQAEKIKNIIRCLKVKYDFSPNKHY